MYIVKPQCSPHDCGATAVEYALLSSLIAVVIAAVVGVLGQEVLGLFEQLQGAF